MLHPKWLRAAAWTLLLLAVLLQLPAIHAQGDSDSIALEPVGGIGGGVRDMVSLPDGSGYILAEGNMLLLHYGGQDRVRVWVNHGTVQDMAFAPDTSLTVDALLYVLTELGLVVYDPLSLEALHFKPQGGQSLTVTSDAVYVAAQAAGIRVAWLDDSGMPEAWTVYATQFPARDVAVSEEANIVFVAFGDDGLGLLSWSPGDTLQLTRIRDVPFIVDHLSLYDDRLAVSGGHQVAVYDTITGQMLQHYRPLHDSRQIVLQQEWAYIADATHGLYRIAIGDFAEPNLSDLVWRGTAYDVVRDDRYIVVAGGQDGIIRLDIGTLDAITLVDQHVFDAPATTVALSSDPGKRWGLIGLSDGSIAVLRWSASALPEVMATHNFEAGIRAVAIRDSIGFVALDSGEIVVVSLSDLAAPRILTTIPIHGAVYDLAVEGTLIFASGSEGLSIIETMRPTEPQIVGQLTGTPPLVNGFIDGKRAYLSTCKSLIIADVDVPENPQILAEIEAPMEAVVVRNLIAFGVAGPNLTIINAASSNAPHVLGQYQAVERIQSIDLRDGLIIAGDGNGAAGVYLDSNTNPFPVESGTISHGSGTAVLWMGKHPLIALTDGTVYDLAQNPMMIRQAGDIGTHLAYLPGNQLLAGGQDSWAIYTNYDTMIETITHAPTSPIYDWATTKGVSFAALGERGIERIDSSGVAWRPAAAAGSIEQIAASDGIVFGIETDNHQRGYLRILDAETLRSITTIALPGPAHSIVTTGESVIASYEAVTGGGIAFIDTVAPLAGLERVGSAPVDAIDLAVVPQYNLIYGLEQDVITLFDMAGWPEVVPVNTIALPRHFDHIAAVTGGPHGTMLLTYTANDLMIWSGTNPQYPQPVDHMEWPITDVWLTPDTAYLAGPTGLSVLPLPQAGTPITVNNTPIETLWHGRTMLYALASDRVLIFDVANPISPVLTAEILTESDRHFVALTGRTTRRNGNWLALQSDDIVQLWHHSSDGSLTQTDTIDLPETSLLAIDTRILYGSSAHNDGLVLAELSGAWRLQTPYDASSFWLADGRILTNNGSVLSALSWSELEAVPPDILHTMPLPITPQTMIINDDTLFAAGDGTLLRINVSNWAAPVIEATLPLPGDIHALTSWPDTDHIAVAAGHCGVRLVDTAGTMQEVGFWDDGPAVTDVYAIGQQLAAGNEHGIVLLAEASEETGIQQARIEALHPIDGGAVNSGTVSLTWSDASGECTPYTYQLWLAHNGDDLQHVQTLDTNTATFEATQDGLMSWQVQAWYGNDVVAESPIWWFQVKSEQQVFVHEEGHMLALPQARYHNVEPMDASTGWNARQLLPYLIGGLLLEVVLIAVLWILWRDRRKHRM